MDAHRFEPELDQPLPRAVKPRDSKVWRDRLLISLVWLSFVGLVICYVQTAYTVPGKVVAVDDLRYTADVVYLRDGVPESITDDIPDRRFLPAVGQQVTVHLHSFIGGHRIEWPDDPDTWSRRLFFAVWTIGVFTVLTGLAACYWTDPWRHRQLARWGTPTVGVVTVVDGHGSYVRGIRYRYTDPIEADEFTGEYTATYPTRVSGPDDKTVGSTITVLIDPSRPERHVALADSTYLPVRTPAPRPVS